MGPSSPVPGSLPGPVVPECAALDWSRGPGSLLLRRCHQPRGHGQHAARALACTDSHALPSGAQAQHPGLARPTTAPSPSPSGPGSASSGSSGSSASAGSSAGPGLPPVTALRFKPAGLGRDAARRAACSLLPGMALGAWCCGRPSARRLRWLLPEKASASASGSGTPQALLGAVAQVGVGSRAPRHCWQSSHSPTPLLLPAAPPASGGSPVAAPPCTVMIWSGAVRALRVAL